MNRVKGNVPKEAAAAGKARIVGKSQDLLNRAALFVAPGLKNRCPECPRFEEPGAKAASMAEVAAGGEDHRDAVAVAGGDHFVVAAGAAGLDDRGDAGGCGGADRIVEGEEGV